MNYLIDPKPEPIEEMANCKDCGRPYSLIGITYDQYRYKRCKDCQREAYKNGYKKHVERFREAQRKILEQS